MASLGSVDLVGAGPGDPGLITVAGRQALATADAVIYDALVSPRLLELVPQGAARLFAGKRAGRAAMAQAEINDLLVRLAREGKRVVRLKGGDPYVFGRGAEEAAHLRAAGVPFRVVPGVTAAVGVASYAGIPLTHRDAASAVALVTGHLDPSDPANAVDWRTLAHFPGTLVVYMGMARLEALCRVLMDGGMNPETSAAVIARGTLPAQRVVTAPLEKIAAVVQAASLGTPAMLVVGRVVDLRSALAWYEGLPLFGQRVLVTRPEGDIDEAAAALERLGADVVQAPLIRIESTANEAAVRQVIEQCGDYHWLVFTSRNGVRSFFECLYATRDARALGLAQVAVIGPATRSAVEGYRVKADLVADAFESEGLARKLVPLAQGQRVLLVCADRGREVLPEALGKVCQLTVLAVYRQREVERLPDEAIRRLETGTIDWITLTSPAIVDRLDALLPEAARARIGREIRLATISPLTTAAAERRGWLVEVEAREATWHNLVDAIAGVVGSGAP